MAKETKEAPGEIRSNTQVITRILLVVIIVVLVGGFLIALFRRPARVLEEALVVPPITSLEL